jgi:hypothetical protein
MKLTKEQKDIIKSLNFKKERVKTKLTFVKLTDEQIKLIHTALCNEEQRIISWYISTTDLVNEHSTKKLLDDMKHLVKRFSGYKEKIK